MRHLRPFLWIVPLVAACSGGGGAPAEPPATAELALFSVSPGTLSSDATTTLQIQCEASETDGVRLEVLGAASFPCDFAGATDATCVIPAGALPSGSHDVRLARGPARSNVLVDALTAVAEPRLPDGSGNHEDDLGSAGGQLRRVVASDYADGDSALAGADRPNPRAISNAVCAQAGTIPNAAGATDFLWQWGQFLDHDIDLTPEAEPAEPADIAVPLGDPQFDPDGTGAVVLHFSRSAYDPGSVPRQQVNAITAFIDASNVYGSDAVRATALRTLDGTGRLLTSDGDLLPFNLDGLDNAGGPDPALFLAGDVRANEQAGLIAMHTLFVREHNRLAGEIRARDPGLSGDEVCEAARRIVAAQMQVITYREFLPVLLGPGALRPYDGYDETVDPRIANSFSTAAYRLGHSMLSSFLLRIDAAGDEIADGHLALRDAFFNPALFDDAGDLDPILRGLAAQQMQELDTQLVDDVRNFLFGPPGAGGLDLASLNLQRGRDHGLASYNDTRAGLGLARRASFAEVSSNPDVQARLAAVYASVDDVDLWVGGLAEDHVPGALVGEVFHVLIRDQFERLRDGDRFWYQRVFSGRERDDLERTRLSDIIRRNTGIGPELSNDVFRVGPTPRGGDVTALATNPMDDVRRGRVERALGRAGRR